MIGAPRERTRTERRRRRGPLRRALPWLVRAAVAAALVAGGIAVGQALEEGPRPPVTRTEVRTLTPQTLPPETVTVTVAR